MSLSAWGVQGCIREDGEEERGGEGEGEGRWESERMKPPFDSFNVKAADVGVKHGCDVMGGGDGDGDVAGGDTGPQRVALRTDWFIMAGSLRSSV